MFLSMILPVYGVEKYIKKCLDSCVNQNIEYSEYEIICVDDGTKDNSGRICDDYARKYPNIVVIHKKNGGLSSARNAGLKIAKGEYIWFIDSDDFIRENVLFEIKKRIRETDCDRLSILPYAFNDEDEHSLQIDSIDLNMSQEKFRNILWTKVIRRKLVTDNNLWFEPITDSIEDAPFAIQLQPHIKKEESLYNKLTYFYRIRAGSMMSSKDDVVIPARLRVSELCKEVIEKKRVGDIPSAYILLYCSMAMVMSKVANMERAERKVMIKDIKARRLFPLKYNREYEVIKYRDDDSFTKRLRRYVYSVGYTRWGYCLARVLNCIADIKNHLRK